MSQVELEVLHGIIISTQTPDTTVKTFPRDSGTAYALSKVTGLHVIQTHRNGKAVDSEKQLLAKVKDGSVVFISGHGREASNVISGAYRVADEDARVVSHSLQLEQYRDLICQNTSKLKAGDKITVVLWSCQAGAGGDNSMAAKLAQLFWQQGIKTRIIAATTNVGRYQPDPKNPDELSSKRLRFRSPKANYIHVFDCNDGQVKESRVSAKTPVHFGVGGVLPFTMREISQAHRRLYHLFPTTVSHLNVNNTAADARRLLRARRRAGTANSPQFCVYNCRLLNSQMKFKLLFNDGNRNKSIELTVDQNGNVFDGDNNQLDLSGESLNDKLKAKINALRQQQIEQQRLREQQQREREIDLRKQRFEREMPRCQPIVTLNASGLANGIHLFKLQSSSIEEFMIVVKNQERNITLNLIANLTNDNRVEVKYRGQVISTLKRNLTIVVNRLMRLEHYNRVMQQCEEVATDGISFVKPERSEPENFNIVIDRDNVNFTFPAKVRDDGKIKMAFYGQYIRVEKNELAQTITQLVHKQALIQAVDNYLERRKAMCHDFTDITKQYLHRFFTCFQFSYQDKCDAVLALKNALIFGDKIKRKHIKAMRQGTLHTTIKEVLEQHPSSLILSATDNTTSVGRFLQPHEETAAVARLR